jgi:hypothetical protein
MRMFIALLICLAAWPPLVDAQTDFARLRVKLGETVYVTDTTTGVEVGGPLKTLSPSQLSIDGHVFSPGPNLTIERRGDPVWDGAAMGFGIGTLFGAALVLPQCGNLSPWACVFAPAVEVAAIGAFIDWRIKGRTTIYGGGPNAGRSSLRVLPGIDAHGKRISLAMRF